MTMMMMMILITIIINNNNNNNNNNGKHEFVYTIYYVNKFMSDIIIIQSVRLSLIISAMLSYVHSLDCNC